MTVYCRAQFQAEGWPQPSLQYLLSPKYLERGWVHNMGSTSTHARIHWMKACASIIDNYTTKMKQNIATQLQLYAYSPKPGTVHYHPNPHFLPPSAQ